MSAMNPSSEEAVPRVVSDVDIGAFSRVEQLIASARLTQDEAIIVTTSDLASDVHVARKEFEMGHLEEAFRAVNRFSNAFDQKVAQWESRARQKEAQKQKLSMLQIRKMIGEHSGVRTRVELVRGQIRRLRGGLDQSLNSPKSQALPPANPETPPASGEAAQPTGPPPPDAAPLVPPACRDALEAAADREARSAVVRQYFEVEAELAAEIRTVQGRNRVSFQPQPIPPMDRLYFLVASGQIILAQRLTAKAVHVRDPHTGRDDVLSLKDFVKHVQQGVWLLRPKSPDDREPTNSR